MDAETIYLLAQPNTVAQTPTLQNYLINGAFDFWQRGTSLTLSAGNANGGAYLSDRWFANVSPNAATGGQYIVSQSTNAPPGFNYSLTATVTVADTYSGALIKNYGFSQTTEASTFSPFAFGTSSAQTITLSFWVYATLSGSYALTFLNPYDTGGVGNQRGYTTNYIVSSAKTWQKVTVSIPGDTATGHWNTGGTTGGVQVYFDFGGNFYSSTYKTWSSGGGYNTNALGTNVMANVGNVFSIAGVQLSLGNSTPNVFSRFASTYGAELAACQRYYYRMDLTQQLSGDANGRIGYGPTVASSPNALADITFPNVMRSSPSMSYYASTSNYSYYNIVGNYGVNSITMNVSTPYGCDVFATCSSNLTGYYGGQLTRTGFGTPAWIDFTAEL
jgi:hypothetical protein